MGGIKRLPKTREEREFDKLMRDRKPSVWEDKGSVGDQHFRSLKAAAQHRTEANNAQNHGALPPLLGSWQAQAPTASRLLGKVWQHGKTGQSPLLLVPTFAPSSRDSCVF